jgi:hypothetical protein
MTNDTTMKLIARRQAAITARKTTSRSVNRAIIVNLLLVSIMQHETDTYSALPERHATMLTV